MIAAVASCRRAVARASLSSSSMASMGAKQVAATTTAARFSLRRSRPAASFFHTAGTQWAAGEETAVSTHAIPPYPKQATGLVGLSVQPDWRNMLTRLYNAQLSELEGIPADNEYRKSVENVCRIRLEILEREADVFKFEAEIVSKGGGGWEGCSGRRCTRESEGSLFPSLLRFVCRRGLARWRS